MNPASCIFHQSTKPSFHTAPPAWCCYRSPRVQPRVAEYCWPGTHWLNQSSQPEEHLSCKSETVTSSVSKLNKVCWSASKILLYLAEPLLYHHHHHNSTRKSRRSGVKWEMVRYDGLIKCCRQKLNGSILISSSTVFTITINDIKKYKKYKTRMTATASISKLDPNTWMVKRNTNLIYVITVIYKTCGIFGVSPFFKVMKQQLSNS